MSLKSNWIDAEKGYLFNANIARNEPILDAKRPHFLACLRTLSQSERAKVFDGDEYKDHEGTPPVAAYAAQGAPFPFPEYRDAVALLLGIEKDLADAALAIAASVAADTSFIRKLPDGRIIVSRNHNEEVGNSQLDGGSHPPEGWLG